MRNIELGVNRETGKTVTIPKDAFATHFHLIGGTGKGKTTALHTILKPLMTDVVDPSCFFVIDLLGNFSEELLLWISSPFCPQEVRDRLIYLEPSREDVVLGFNPLVYDTEAHGYYKVARATDVILRAWESTNIEAMPRLARWVFNSFWAAAQLGMTIADCTHLLLPGSKYHKPILRVLPEGLRNEWTEILGSRSGEATKVLDSSRNRLKPYFESSILRNMFGSTENRLDVAQFMHDRRIVIVNLAPNERLSAQVANSIGGLLLNEILATARSLSPLERTPTYMVLDEFQNFVGPDIEHALPEVRQLQLRLMLSHQSLGQLKRGDHDLTSLIFQAQSRLIFGVQGEDADLLAHELASLKFDPKKIKDEHYSKRQLLTGHTIVELTSRSQGKQEAENWNRQYGENWDSKAREASGTSTREGEGGSSGHSTIESLNQSLKPEYETFDELSSRVYYSFEEQKQMWASQVRGLPTGHGLLRLVNDPNIYEVNVKRTAHGYLSWDAERLAEYLPEVIKEVNSLKEKNFQADLFVSADVIERETQARLDAILKPKIVIETDSSCQTTTSGNSTGDPFNG